MTLRCIVAAILGIVLGAAMIYADARYTAMLQNGYDGRYPDLYHAEYDRLRILVNQAQLEVSSQLGLLNYREGFRVPLVVSFADELPPGTENALAYVQPFGTRDHLVRQEMVVNLKLLSEHNPDFDRLLYHEMTHAVLNDAADRPLPSWTQEGLAVYIAGDGDTWVAKRLGNIRRSQAHLLVHDPDNGTLDYAADFLAFKFLEDRYSVNALQGFVRDLAQGKSAEEAVTDMTGGSYDQYKKDLRDYATKVYEERAKSDL